MEQTTASITFRAEPCQNTCLLKLRVPHIASVARPGQFVTLRCGEEVLLRRPFSIHRASDEYVELLYTVLGPGTQWLSSRNPGDTLNILGPLGNGFQIHHGSRNLLLIAGGIGIAPMVFLTEKALSDGFSVKLIIGAKTTSQLYPETIERAEVIRITEDGSSGEKGLVTDLLPSLVTWADQLFACGPVPMYRAMADMAGMFQGKSVQILMERVMACGVGACRGCALTTTAGIQMVCSNGPVFELSHVMS